MGTSVEFRLLKQSYPDLESGLEAFTQAYLASVAAVDECIGQVIDALDNSPFKNNTIVVVTSDHGLPTAASLRGRLGAAIRRLRPSRPQPGHRLQPTPRFRRPLGLRWFC